MSTRICMALTFGIFGAVLTDARAAVDFEREIRPLVDTACLGCHGPQKQKGQLRLDSRAALMTGGLSGAAVTPGKSGDSVLVKRLLGADGEERMPPADKAKALTPAAIALIRRWIDEGAVWPEGSPTAVTASPPVHWAYVKPVRPSIPAVKKSGWARTDLDRFVLARLEKEGLVPSREADRETLLRRVSLDLTGLPPTPTQLLSFLNDRRPDAYERVVDGLLASPGFGERWARWWLDLARYADSNGYEKDRPRIAWKYRDWVIDAFNRNLSFKQFTVEQIAGDMLPTPTVAQKIATGLHRNTMLNQEGGIDIEEARWETLVDRVGTTGTVWLGSTLACAQCHNHKYDPLAQRDFYRFLAFFDNGNYGVEGSGVDKWILEPSLLLPNEKQQQKREELEAQIAGLKDELRVVTPAQRAAYAAWEGSVREAEARFVPLTVDRAQSKGGANLSIGRDGSVFASGANPVSDEYQLETTTKLPSITGLRIEALSDPRLPNGGPGRSKDGNFFLTAFDVRVSPIGDEGDGQPVKWKTAISDESSGGGSRAENLVSDDAGDGWAVDPAMSPRPTRRQAVLVLDKPVGSPKGVRLSIRLSHQMPRQTRNLGHFRLSVTDAPDPTLAAIVPTRWRPSLDLPVAQRTAEQRRALEAIYGDVAVSLKPVRQRLGDLRRAITDLRIDSALVLEERPGFARPATHLRVRGAYLSRGEVVYAGTPKVLPPLPESQPLNRLGLGHWLVDDANPLTARVTVNRFWEQYFGRGIVETTEDFGTQGAAPSHPELLDWMATEFMRKGWDMKAMHRTIVMSATYRQHSAASPALVERDPANRLWARGPRVRLEAESIRDVALHAAGLLSPKVGGPSVFPPQPEGIWNVPYSSETWITSQGEDRHRRGLYTFIRRSAPYPSMLTFDGPSREACTARRIRTNTPLQALVTLNDPVFLEAARALGDRIRNEVPVAAGLRARVTHGFRLATSRSPSAADLRPIEIFFAKEQQRYAADLDGARRLLGLDKVQPELADRAAWMLVANVLLNLDETITKE